MALEADYNDDAFPLELVVDQSGQGGVGGLPATVAVRLSPTADSYLDWTTNTFKTSGWGLKNKPMTDIGAAGGTVGMYQAILNVQALGFTPLTGLPQVLIAEYTTPPGSNTGGLASDTVIVSELRPDAKRARQAQTNRMESLGGNPGTLTTYDDDNVTPLTTQTLLDWNNNAVDNTDGTPAKRGGA